MSQCIGNTEDEEIPDPSRDVGEELATGVLLRGHADGNVQRIWVDGDGDGEFFRRPRFLNHKQSFPFFVGLYLNVTPR